MSAAIEKVVGRYALFDTLGTGGMATVHLGRLFGGGGFSRLVAVKVLHPNLAANAELRTMFVDEARVAARIQHPHVVQTLDVVATDGGVALVMEYVPGASLSQLIRAVRKAGEVTPVEIVASILVGVLEGLHAAHEATDKKGKLLGLIHRDVSPQNVMIGQDGVPKVIDFGIAKAAGRMHETRAGQIKGKLAYMPREQLLGRKIDRRADIYSAGLVLWELLTLRRAFPGTDVERIQGVLGEKLPGPKTLRSNLSDALDRVVRTATAPNPDDRFDTAADFAAALENATPLASRRRVADYLDRFVGDRVRAWRERASLVEAWGDDDPVTRESLIPQAPPSLRRDALESLTLNPVSQESTIGVRRPRGKKRQQLVGAAAGGGEHRAAAGGRRRARENELRSGGKEERSSEGPARLTAWGERARSDDPEAEASLEPSSHVRRRDSETPPPSAEPHSRPGTSTRVTVMTMYTEPEVWSRVFGRGPMAVIGPVAFAFAVLATVVTLILR